MDEFAGADRSGKPPVVRLAVEGETPARHRDGDAVDRELMERDPACCRPERSSSKATEDVFGLRLSAGWL